MENLLKCNFCGRKKDEITFLISGINGHICNFCIEKTYSIIHRKFSTEKKDFEGKVPGIKNQEIQIKKPKEIKDFLDKYIIGQNEAKKIISVAVYNHYKRIQYDKNKNKDDIEIEKSNILLIGNTGTGKTLLAKSISKLLKIPFTIADATTLTEAGYVGEDVESILTRLLQSVNYDINHAEKGIIFIDEIDKISRKRNNPSITRDVSGEGVQQALLKLLEGSIINVPPQGGRKHPDQKMIQINTDNILFIAGGTFDGIERIVSDRINQFSIGFITKKRKKEKNNENYLQNVMAHDLRKFGLIPELIGRFPIITYLNPLNKTTLKKILVEPKNALIKQYQKLFYMDEISMNITDDALDIIVEKTIKLGLGARGLRTFCEKIFVDYIFEMKESKKILNIDRNMVIKKLSYS
ncbi:ATP-dependent Clp protease ATP-binding subunit ClpX [Blattabacterium sp. (Cryptocercus kyebangensis)]|uniref:ATP-dependent Clp protease ATP-binding subunit ClpX n=1 Tax=Blattabacterium sp. (Cryptocercus kyebangensis) TaxID=298656 RepID=UPI000D7D1455|nr:ATP-dependent Clp protease ATP-binding subunit ClpX [Blattabacterium sp. (Cryptocercus kyebangensis)]AWU43657.1 ATP-dependent Clp protease ATP-binding subunit ClpX [Blattabacterium sp. (Cryptocercus kyebangensis)]